MDVSQFTRLCDELFLRNEPVQNRTFNGYQQVYVEARSQIHDTGWVYKSVAHLRRKLVILYYERNLDYSKYVPVLDSICDVVRIDIAYDWIQPSETDWVELIRIIMENRTELHFFERDPETYSDAKLHTFAKAYLALKQIGVEFTEVDNKFYISSASYQLIDKRIDHLCKVCGGEELLSKLAESIGPTFNAVTGRFMEYRYVSMGSAKVLPAIPFGYLMAIVSKYAGCTGRKNADSFEHLLMLVTDLIVVFEIQPYSCWEAIHLGVDDVLEFIQKNILYDGFVGINQTKANYASGLIKFLQDKFNAVDYSIYDVNVRDVTRVSKALISLAHTKRFTDVQIKDIAAMTGMAEFKVALTMDRFLSVQSGDVNSELRFPPSSLEINHYFKPAIKIGGKFKLFPKSIAAQGCLNSVCNTITHPAGQWINSLDSKLGYAIEDFLRSAFINKGINIAFGDRAVVGAEEDFEADLICETDKAIFIFELKKKGLTRQAQAGDSSKVLADLADSMLAAHVQAMKIENALRKDKIITLINQEKRHTIMLNNRTVKRISVSLHDFGAIQDKTVFQKILTVAVSSDAKHPDPDIDTRLDKWRKHANSLKRLGLESGEIGVQHQTPFHYSLFMSIPQIILVLDQSKNSEDFFKHIDSFIHTSTGSRDTYTEFLNRLNFITRCRSQGLPI